MGPLIMSSLMHHQVNRLGYVAVLIGVVCLVAVLNIDGGETELEAAELRVVNTHEAKVEKLAALEELAAVSSGKGKKHHRGKKHRHKGKPAKAMKAEERRRRRLPRAS